MTNNKQQTAVNYLLSHIWTTDWVNYTREQKLAIIEHAKEMQKQQSQAYAEFCVTCDRNKLPLLDFESWLKLPSKEDSAEATLDEYNRMEEEWEMENYNQMKEEQSE
jgi:hypothetical protein